MPTVRASKNSGMDVSLGSNPLEHPVEVVAQLDDCAEGHTQVPTGAQPLNHFRKPYFASRLRPFLNPLWCCSTVSIEEEIGAGGTNGYRKTRSCYQPLSASVLLHLRRWRSHRDVGRMEVGGETARCIGNAMMCSVGITSHRGTQGLDARLK